VRTELIAGGSTDDPIFWQNQENLDASLLVVTGKDGGAEVYDLDGTRVQHFDVGQPNNGDVVYDSQGDIVAFSDREENQVVFPLRSDLGDSMGAIDTVSRKSMVGFCHPRQALFRRHRDEQGPQWCPLASG
jgi:myo-inositol-hexaphosphate 3-phosphohydrolase